MRSLVPNSGHPHDVARLATHVGPVVPHVLAGIAALQVLAAVGYWFGVPPTASRANALILVATALTILVLGGVIRRAADREQVDLAGTVCVLAATILSAAMCAGAWVTDLGITIALPYCVLVAVGATSFWLRPRHFMLGQIGIFLPALVLLLSSSPSAIVWSFCIQISGVTLAISTGMFLLGRRTSLRVFRLASELEHRATYDGLTGVLNRSTWMDRAVSRLALDQLQHRRTSCLFLDLNDFKHINDDYGHDAGDEVLSMVSDALRQCADVHHLVGRFGGDEFVALLPGTAGEEANALAERIHATLQGCRLGDERIYASIGVATSDPGETLATLMQRADLAMLEAKAHARAAATAGRHDPVALAPVPASATA